MKLYSGILFFLSLFAATASAQDHVHSHARNEIGISPGVTWSPSHEQWGFGIHAHYFRTLGEHSPWALGGSVERVSSHGAHWTMGIGAKYSIMDRLNLALLPGITFFGHSDAEEHAHTGHDPDHNSTNKAQFSIHLELGYDLIHTTHFHFGPAIDYSWTRGDTHFMLGVHCAYGF